MTERLIDTHVHVWDLDRAEYPWLAGNTSILNRTWDIGDLEKERIEAGVTEAILVQAAGNFQDTALMLEVAEKKEWIVGVVAWLPLMDPATTEELLEKKYLKEKYFKGARHQIHDEKDPEWLLQPEVIDSLDILASHGIPYDVVGILPSHIETVLKLAEKLPDLKMVFDHLNQPPISTREKFGKWGELMKRASEHENLYAKISGLGTAAGNFENWTADDIRPYIEFALEHFGTKRCFCGGDWPVSLLAGSYTKTWKAYRAIIKELITSPEQENIFYKNATEFYSL